MNKQKGILDFVAAIVFVKLRSAGLGNWNSTRQGDLWIPFPYAQKLKLMVWVSMNTDRE